MKRRATQSEYAASLIRTTRTRLAVVVGGLLFAAMPTQAVAKTPPSFALWVVRQKAASDALKKPIGDGCLRVYPTNDAKAGECLVKGLLGIWPRTSTRFDRAVARIARPQTPACKRAIRAYWLAERKATAATLIYLKAHEHVSATQFNNDLHSEPFSTIRAVENGATAHAIRVCG
jgi:hypothetical protein